ncbi:seipin-like isoform X1 [Sphaeramia orbicularis]|uniref:seipin-like isoform X1 n=1 Tax=Sphaeramia orbicularis TaxID=375764 RepID=UPI00117C5399|nr:seipin-like isoform X1 [Sphaeramia orbicularis]XP_030000591.1 seipin-like isoform X1 [Sphaeramia orbicularis]
MDQQTHLHAGGYGQPSVIINRNLQILKDTFGTMVSRARQRFIQGFLVFSFVLLVLWIATFLYGSFYYSYMPKASFSTPVNYYYRTDCESPTSFLCSYPLANISLMRNKKHVLTLGQPYRISLHLEMPDSPVNREIGMFMIRTTCFSRESRPVANSARSARQLLSTTSSHFSILRYHSELLRTLGTLLFLPAYLSGAAEQKQVLEVELFSDYTDDPYSPSDTAIIEILSSKVQIYSSHLYIHAHFTGLRYLLFNFPAFSAMVGISSNFVFLSILFLLGYVRQILRFNRKPEQIRAHVLRSEREQNQQDNERNTPEGSTRIRSTNLRQRQNHGHQT